MNPRYTARKNQKGKWTAVDLIIDDVSLGTVKMLSLFFSSSHFGTNVSPHGHIVWPGVLDFMLLVTSPFHRFYVDFSCSIKKDSDSQFLQK